MGAKAAVDVAKAVSDTDTGNSFFNMVAGNRETKVELTNKSSSALKLCYQRIIYGKITAPISLNIVRKD
jgi:hypothetical protein